MPAYNEIVNVAFTSVPTLAPTWVTISAGEPNSTVSWKLLSQPTESILTTAQSDPRIGGLQSGTFQLDAHGTTTGGNINYQFGNIYFTVPGTYTYEFTFSTGNSAIFSINVAAQLPPIKNAITGFSIISGGDRYWNHEALYANADGVRVGYLESGRGYVQFIEINYPGDGLLPGTYISTGSFDSYAPIANVNVGADGKVSSVNIVRAGPGYASGPYMNMTWNIPYDPTAHYTMQPRFTVYLSGPITTATVWRQYDLSAQIISYPPGYIPTITYDGPNRLQGSGVVIAPLFGDIPARQLQENPRLIIASGGPEIAAGATTGDTPVIPVSGNTVTTGNTVAASNISLVVTGNDNPVNEYATGWSVTGVVTVNASVDGGVAATHVFRGQYATSTDVAINGNTVTISGSYKDIFPKSITYQDVNRVPKTITKFGELPSEFFLLTNFTASHMTSVDAVYYITVDTTGNATSGSGMAQSNVLAGNITQTVTNDYTAGKLALQAAVPKGTF